MSLKKPGKLGYRRMRAMLDIRRITEDLREDEEAFIAYLRAVVPSSLELWATKTKVFTDLLENGSSDPYYHNDPENREAYGYISLEDMQDKLGMLKRAWQGLVTITVKRNDLDERLEVEFTIM